MKHIPLVIFFSILMLASTAIFSPQQASATIEGNLYKFDEGFYELIRQQIPIGPSGQSREIPTQHASIIITDGSDVDNISPIITAPDDIVAEATGVQTIIDIGAAVVADNRDPNPAITDDAPDSFPIGETIITYTATDNSGNAATDAQRITIQDTTPPVIAPIPDISLVDTNTADFEFVATDIFDVTASCNYNSGDSFPVGTTAVLCTATDSNGNSANISFNVIVPSQDTVFVAITEIFDGESFVPFTDGITVNTDTPKFKGVSSGYDYVVLAARNSEDSHTVIGTTTAIFSDGSFERGNRVLPDDTYAIVAHSVTLGSFVVDTSYIDPNGMATITQIYDGHTFVDFVDGMTITENTPRFIGTSDNLDGYLQLKIDDSQVGYGTNTYDDGSWIRGWKNAPLVDNTYTVEILNHLGAVILTGTLTIDSSNDENMPPDTTKPVIQGMDDIIASTFHNDGSSITFDVVATDDGGTFDVACDHNSGDVFPVGTTLVSCTATDGSGNSAQIPFSIIISLTLVQLEPFETVSDDFRNANHWDFEQSFKPNPGQYHRFASYAFAISDSSGNPAPAGLISGDGFTSLSSTARTISLDKLTDDDSLYLSFDYRVTSDTDDSHVTNGRLHILDSDGNILHDVWLVRGGTVDTNWRTYNLNIADIVDNTDEITVRILSHDSWVADWNQKLYVDNFYVGLDDPSLSGGASGAGLEDLPASQEQLILQLVKNHGTDIYDVVSGMLADGSYDDIIAEMLRNYNYTSP